MYTTEAVDVTKIGEYKCTACDHDITRELALKLAKCLDCQFRETDSKPSL